jgi:tape measure domain-containing protein
MAHAKFTGDAKQLFSVIDQIKKEVRSLREESTKINFGSSPSGGGKVSDISKMAAQRRAASQAIINGIKEETAAAIKGAAEKRKASQDNINYLREQASMETALAQEKRKSAAEAIKGAAEERKASQAVVNAKREETAQIQKVASQRKAASESVIQGINKEIAALKKKTAAHQESINAAKASSAAQLEADKLALSGSRKRLSLMREEDYAKQRAKKADVDLQKSGRKFHADWAEAARMNAVGVDKFGNAIKKTAAETKKLRGEMGLIRTAAKRFLATMLAFATGYLVITGLTRAFGALKYAILDFNDLISRTRISFTTMMDGNAKAADRLLVQLQKFAATTSFSFTDLLPLSKQMIALGVATKDQVIPAMEGIGGAAAALDVGAEGMGRIIRALGQMGQRARASAEEFNQQLADVGVNGLKYLAEAYGKSQSQIVEYMKKGMIGGKDAQKAVLEGLRREYSKHLKAQENEFSVSWSNIKDSATVVVAQAFKPMFSSLSKFTKEISDIVSTDAFAKWAQDTATRVQVFGGKILGVFKVIYDFLTSGSPLAQAALYGLTAAIIRMAVVAIFGSLWSSIAVIATWVSSIVVGMWTAGAAVVTFVRTATIASLWARFTAVLAAARLAVVTFGTTSATSFIVAGGPLAWLIAAIAAFGIAWATNLGGIRDLTSKWARGIVEAIAGAYDWIAEKTGGEGGFLASTKSYLDNGGFDKDMASLKSTLVSTLALPSFDIKRMLADANKEIAAAFKNAPSIPGITPAKLLPEKDDGEKRRKAAAAAAARLEKDKLQDMIAMYDQLAKAVEDSTKRQMGALTSLRDKLRDLFGTMQDTLLKEGVITNPLGPLISSFERFISLGSRMKEVVNKARLSLDAIGNARAPFQSRLDTMSGGDGSGVGYSGGGATSGGSSGSSKGEAIARIAAARIASGEARNFVRLCQRLARTTVQQVSDAYNRYFSGSAKSTMRNFQKAGIGGRYKPGMKLAPGSLLYSSTMGGGYGHVQTIGPNGERIDQHGVNKFKQSNFQWFVPPPGGRVSAGSKAPKYLPKNNAAAISSTGNGGGADPRAFLAEMVSSIDGTLSKISAVPKAWGAAVRDTGQNTTRFMAQTMLANTELQQMFIALAGQKKFDEFAAKLRKTANQMDFMVNRTKAVNAALDEMQDNRKKIALSQMGDNPVNALELEFAPGGKYADLPTRAKKAQEQANADLIKRMIKSGAVSSRTNIPDVAKATKEDLRASTYAGVAEKARRATEDFTKAQNDQIAILDVSNKYLKQNSYNQIELSRAVEVAKFEQEQYNQLIKDGVKDADAKNQVALRSISFQAAYDQALSTNALTEYSQRMNDLTKEYAALNDESVQQIAHRAVFGRDDAGYLDSLQLEAEYVARVAYGLAQINKEQMGRKRDQGDSFALLGQKSDIAGKGLFGAAFDEEATRIATFMSRRNEIFRRTGDSAYALKTAEDEAFSEMIINRLAKMVDYQKEHNQAIYETALSYQLATIKAGIYNTTVSGSFDQEKLLAYAEAEDAARKEAKANNWNNDQLRESIRLRKQDIDLRMAGNKVSEASSRNLAMANQLIDIRASYAQAQRELTADSGHYSNLVDQLEIEKEKMIAAGKWVELTEEQIQLQDELYDKAKKMDQLAITKITMGLQQQIEAMSYTAGAARDAFNRSAELDRMPGMTAETRDQIMGMETYLLGLQRTEEATRDWADNVRGIFDSALNNIYETGFGSFFSNVLNGFVDLFNKISSQILSAMATKMLMNLIPGMGGFGGMITGAASAPMSFASGASRIPFDGMPAILHRNEAVLNAAQAEDWRRSQSVIGRGGNTSFGRGGDSSIVINVGNVNTPDARKFMADMEGVAAQRGQSPSRRTTTKNMRKTVDSARG